MTTNEIRTKFLDFFKSKGSSIIASDSLVPKDDPTVLFTTAGMQQFKPQFLGHIDGFTKAATCQKCLRTDDLDVVGKTDFHHTFFEMLGNFSFGDYFKKEAIHWAWEFLTRELKLSQDKLWVSVYHEDTEAYGIWANEIKIPADRIVKLGDKSNFWPSNARLNGPNGPCGPCSEIFYDYGVNPNCPKGKSCDPDCSCGRFSEVWNLVFTQFNRKDGGVLEALPAKNIDTGMGLERLAAVVQGKKSNYETDNWAAILKVIKDTFKINHAQLTENEYRVIADHIRAITFGIADGVVPSNEGRGYVIRKLIVDSADLAIRSGIDKPVIYTFVDIVVDVMMEPYSELGPKFKEIREIICRVEEAYIKIRREKIPDLVNKIHKIKLEYVIEVEKAIEELGELVFLYRDTHGLALQTIEEVLKNNDVPVNLVMAVFNKLMLQQQERSRAGSKMTGDVYVSQDFAVSLPKTDFLGYSKTKADAKVIQVIGEGKNIKVILDHTPFYAESGGQVGDSGYLTNVIPAKAGIQNSGSPIKTFGDDKFLKIRVNDTHKINDIYIHSGTIEQGSIKTGDNVQAVIDEPRRQAIMRNHTATHLLQAALRETLGAHIKQQGSLVEEGRLRFDFTHPKGIKPEEMKKIENRLNEFISRADKVTTEVLALEEAKKKGALAFFAEKYGQTVRVVSIGDYSREFCGGTHVSSTGDIEAIKIVSEGSVAQGIRRVEAVTGNTAVNIYIKQQKDQEALREQSLRQKQIEKERQNQEFERVKDFLDDEVSKAKVINGSKIIKYKLNGGDKIVLRQLSDIFKQKTKSAVIVLGGISEDNVSLIISVTDDLVARGIKANELIEQIAPFLEGSGGGRPQLAQAGSKQPQKLDGALDKAVEIVSVAMTLKV